MQQLPSMLLRLVADRRPCFPNLGDTGSIGICVGCSTLGLLPLDTGRLDPIDYLHVDCSRCLVLNCCRLTSHERHEFGLLAKVPVTGVMNGRKEENQVVSFDIVGCVTKSSCRRTSQTLCSRRNSVRQAEIGRMAFGHEHQIGLNLVLETELRDQNLALFCGQQSIFTVSESLGSLAFGQTANERDTEGH